MKILMINSVCGIGSTGRICTDIADALKKNGDECLIAYGRGTVPLRYQDMAYQIGGRADTAINGVKARLLDNEGFNARRNTRRLIRKIEEFQPQVVHLHNLHGYYIHLGVLMNYLKSCRCRVVWTLHDCWSFTGHCAHFVDCGQWKTHCGNCPKRRSYPASLLLDRSYRNYESKRALFTQVPMTIVTPSRWLADLAAQSFLQNHPCRVIHNGINLSVFHRTESRFRGKYGLENKKIILGVSSVWTRSKGLDDFIRLSALTDDSVRIVLVGLTSKQRKALPGNIIGVERTDSVEELAQIYSAADIFFNPTYLDTYPTVNLEAQACGTPVVTYRTGGSVESVPPENVLEQGDYQGIMTMLDRPLAVKQEDFSKENMIRRYLALYREPVKP